LEPIFTVHFSGHPNILATNRMTLEVTKEDFLTLRGDCIMGIMADASSAELSGQAKAFICRDGSRLRFDIKVERERFSFFASGSRSLTLTHPMSMVIRRSTYSCPRTLAVKSTAAACDLPRPLVARLASGAQGELAAYEASP
jgi:hypothetical protein